MDLAVMSPAERDGELIADLAAECRCLRKSQMMCVCRAPTADQARLFGDRFDMVPVANPARHRQGQNRFVDGSLLLIANSPLPCRPFRIGRFRTRGREGREL